MTSKRRSTPSNSYVPTDDGCSIEESWIQEAPSIEYDPASMIWMGPSVEIALTSTSYPASVRLREPVTKGGVPVGCHSYVMDASS